MTTKTILTKDQLAERYATLSVQSKNIERQMREAADELNCLLADGEILRTPEYTVSKNQGRKVLFWTEAGKPQKKQFEQELIKQGFMTEKIGESYVSCRFTKQAESEE